MCFQNSQVKILKAKYDHEQTQKIGVMLTTFLSIIQANNKNTSFHAIENMLERILILLHNSYVHFTLLFTN